MRVAILGCGQLARMMALAGMPLGIRFSFIVDNPLSNTDCVEGLGVIVHPHPELSSEQLFEQAGRPDVLTVEKEQVDLKLLSELDQHCEVLPSVNAISICKHRLHEKDFLSALGVPVAPYRYATCYDEIRHAIEQLELPVVIKSVSEGYDGKHQWTIRDKTQLDNMLQSASMGPWIVEKWIAFSREVSLIGVRSTAGDIAYYPLAHNVHTDGILIETVAPAADISPLLMGQLQGYFETIVTQLDYVGVMAMECFIDQEGALINELAPRVHNSGHWTQIGSVSCQFENHIRAITGLSLGSTHSHGIAGMLNILNLKAPPLTELDEQSSVHWYNKQPRAGRKLGHVNFLAQRRDEVINRMQQFKQHL